MPMKKNILVVLGVTIGIFVSIALRSLLTKAQPPVVATVDPAVKQKQDDENRRKIAWRIVTPRIEIAQEEAIKAVETRVQEVRAFFDERQKRIPAYADRVLSLRSKWVLGKSKLPGTDKEAHTKFLKEEFARIVFSEAELSQAVMGATENFVRDIEAIENALLVKIRADLQDTPECAAVLPDLKTDALFQSRFAKTTISLSGTASADLKVNIGRLLGSEIAAVIAIRVGTAVATRLGVSAAILGTGAAAGPETLGVTVIAGILVDQIAGWVIGWFYDPESEISKTLSAELKNLATLIVVGDEKTRGLKAELTQLSEQRKELRNNALQEMILQPEVTP